MSGTLRGIYLIRYLLFSGGAAIALALVERWAVVGQRPWHGLVVGFGLGLVLFRSQVSRARAPTLLLSRSALSLVGKGKSVHIPWGLVEQCSVAKARLNLKLSAPLSKQSGSSTTLSLDPRDFGTSSQLLTEELAALAADPAQRARLPSDEELASRYPRLAGG